MGIRLKQYKNGDYRVWSSNCDDWLTERMTEQETIEYLIQQIQERADRTIRELKATFPAQYFDINGTMFWNEELKQKYLKFSEEERQRIINDY